MREVARAESNIPDPRTSPTGHSPVTRTPGYHGADSVPDDRAPNLDAIRILVVDDEVNLRFAVERGLRKAGHISESASTVRQAIERIRNEPYDVVICDLKMPGGDGHELVAWLASYSPSTRVIVVSAFVTPAFRKQYPPATGVRILEKPVELADLVKVVEEIGPRKGFYGNSIEVELFDYVQMIALSGRDKKIEVVTPAGHGRIWFEHGDIVHAEYSKHLGEQAFYKMLAVGRGTFKEVMYTDSPQRSIMNSATHLLMEAARMMDEGILGLDPGGAAQEIVSPERDETSFADVARDVSARDTAKPGLRVDDDLMLPTDDDEESIPLRAKPSKTTPSPRSTPLPPSTGAHGAASDSGASTTGLLDDPETRELMLGQFFQYEGVNGVAIISSTGKVLAEDMRGNTALVTLAGFYMRGAARIARALGHNVFDGVVARAATGQQLLMVGMGATSAVLSIEIGCDPESVRREIMGVEA
jgi:CheY-like chemotaxis protein